MIFFIIFATVLMFGMATVMLVVAALIEAIIPKPRKVVKVRYKGEVKYAVEVRGRLEVFDTKEEARAQY